MGEAGNQPFQLSFDAALKVEFQGSRVTSDRGLILVGELVRQSVYRRLAGHEDVNDAERLCHDPTFRLIGSDKIWERGAALTSRVHSFETELLTQAKNLTGLAAINREMVARADAMASSRCEVDHP